MSSDPYRFVIPRPDPPPPSQPFFTPLMKKVLKGVAIFCLIPLWFVIAGILTSRHNYDVLLRKGLQATRWAQERHGQVIHCHQPGYLYSCDVRLPDGNYRIIYDNTSEPLIVTKELP